MSETRLIMGYINAAVLQERYCYHMLDVLPLHRTKR